jgi:hypothetical protein
MSRRRVLPFVAAASVVLLGAGPSDPVPSANAPLVVKVTPVTLAPGGRAEATITLELRKEYRIVAPGTESQYAQPALLAFDAADGVFVEPPVWPAGISWRAELDDPEMKVYEGRLELKVVVYATPKAALQEVTLRGRLRYQMIRGNFALKAAVMPLAIQLKVAAAPGAAPQAKKPATRP